MNEKMQIPAFAEPITDLGDQPNLPSAELKRRFQAPADELREAHNALAGVVHGITSATYPDTVTEEMLAAGVREKIEGKAEETALAAEQTAREEADTALSARVSTVEAALPEKCEVYFGTYRGNGEPTQDITLGFTPKAVIVAGEDGAMFTSYIAYGGIAFADHQCISHGESVVTIIENGFRVYVTRITSSSSINSNQGNMSFFFIAFR